MEQTLQIVSYEQAKRLAALGFVWETHYAYVDGRLKTDPPIYAWSQFKGYVDELIDAPYTALALKWLRNVEGARYNITFDHIDNSWDCFWIIPKLDLWKTTGFYDSYEEAESALLDAVLTELEKGDAQ
jgi:hypothetical protein